jgi:hypothetical protein
MLLRTTDPFRDLDRLTQQFLGTTNRPAVMAMDAWREGDSFVIEFDLPGVAAESIDLDVERNVLTVRAERVTPTVTGRCWPASGRAARSAASWSSATTSTSSGSRRATRAACCGSSYRSRRRPSHARSRSTRDRPPVHARPSRPDGGISAGAGGALNRGPASPPRDGRLGPALRGPETSLLRRERAHEQVAAGRRHQPP